MKKIIATTLLAVVFAVAANAGKVVTDSIESKILGTTVKYKVYLPDGYGKGVEGVANAGLRSVAWFFDCGDDDHLLPLSCEIHSLMSKAGIKNELRVRDGIHNWEYWHNALRLSLPFASRNFR